MNFVTLGTGHWHSGIYISDMEKLGHKLVGVHEDDPKIAAVKAARMNRQIETDPVKVLDETQPDFAVVMASHRRMPELLKLVIDRNIPFLVEKPGAITAAEIQPLAELAARKNLFGAVAFCARWNPAVQLVGNWIKQGKLGRLGWLKLEYFVGPVSRYPAMHSPWMLHRSETGGGCMHNDGIHALDVLNYWGLQPVFEHGILAQPWGQADYDDFSALWLRCGNAVATVECGYSQPSAGRGFVFELMAEKGIVRLNKTTLTFIGADKTVEEFTFPSSGNDYRTEMMADLFARFERQEQSPTPLDTSLASLRLIDSLYTEANSKI